MLNGQLDRDSSSFVNPMDESAHRRDGRKVVAVDDCKPSLSYEPLGGEAHDQPSDRIGLVGRVKSRGPSSPARDLEMSPLFRGRRSWVERTCQRWLVPSALHGLVDPEVVEPYDLTLVTGFDPREARLGQAGSAVAGRYVGSILPSDVRDPCRFRLSRLRFDAGDPQQRRTGRNTHGAPLSGSAARCIRQHIAPPSHQRSTAAKAPPSLGPRRDGRGRKYSALSGDELAHRKWSQASFSEIEHILGFPLPASAVNHPAWWADDDSHSHALAWTSLGLETRNVDLNTGTVSFVLVRR